MQTGRYVETRTNVFIGTTAALGGLTILAAILTDWGGSSDDGSKTESAKEDVQIKPTVLWVDAPDGKGQGVGAGAPALGGIPVFGAAGVF